MAVGFFLSPFIIHRLGNQAYGIWVVAISSIGYLGMLDLGMRSSVLRFVSKGHTQGNHAAASAALSAALWLRLRISAVVLILAALLAYVFPMLFHQQLPPQLAESARIAVMIIGINLALGMSLGVFGGVLSGLNRYDLQTAVTLIQIVLRVAGVVFVLRRGYGLVAIALCEFVAALVGNLLLVALARRIYPELRISLARPDTEVLRSLWSYSFYAFLTTVGVQLVYQTDNVVVGSFVSASAVTFYAIGNSLSRYADQFITSMTMSFVPAASTLEAAGDNRRVQKLYIIGTRVVMALSLPVLMTLLVRGRTFIGLWMGPQYSHTSGTVLMILGTALIFSQANQIAVAIAFGTERHQALGKWAVVEGVSNLVLSVVLVRRMGVYGVAVGTLIPSLCIQLVFWPSYIGKLVGLRRWEVFAKVWGPMLLCAIPFALVSYVLNLRYPAHTMFVFFAQTAALLPVFLLPVAAIFREEIRNRALPVVRNFVASRRSLFA